MCSVASLLNPVPDEYRQLLSPCSTRPVSQCSNSNPLHLTHPQKKQKLQKDAPVFVKGQAHGLVKYLPYQNCDAATTEELRKFAVYPYGQITKYPRHIPYNSDKKTFVTRTGREAFEVFQYTFKIPDDSRDTSFTVMWDYNIGLVRITPFFKCLGYAKTSPAKMLNKNPGLREVCHSITGGALAAQGYWMPYAAAKAVTATFCYSIRYALVPLFGPSYPDICTKPESDHFSAMIIDPQIIQICKAEAQTYTTSSPMSSPMNTPSSNGFHATPSLPPPTPFLIPRSPVKQWSNKRTARPCPITSIIPPERFDREVSESPRYLASPPSTSHSTFGNYAWTAVNTPRSIPSTMQAQPYPHLPSLRESLGDASSALVSAEPGPISNSPLSDSSTDSSGISPKTRKRVRALQLTDDEDQDIGRLGADHRDGPAEEDDSIEGLSSTERRAAYILWQLHLADAGMREERLQREQREQSHEIGALGKRRRASE